MAYSRNPSWKNWPDKATPITSVELENIEQGIVGAADTADVAVAALPTKADVGHTHDDRYYTEAETDASLSNKADVGHNHDSRYYLESEVDGLLAGKSNTVHTHTASQVTDLDSATAASVSNTVSQTRGALETNYATLVPVGRFGVSSALPNTDQTAGIQAAIDSGLPIYFPAGRYVATGLVPKSGMHLVGAGKGDPDNATSPRTILRTVGGNLFASGTIMSVIENMELQGSITGGDLIRGDWSQGVFRSVRFLQYNTTARCVNVTGWIDMAIEGSSEMLASGSTVIGPCFFGSTSGAKIAQFSFRDVRVRGGDTLPAIYLTAPGGGVNFISSVTFDNVNFEVCNGGCIRMFSVRGVSIRGCGAWDLTSSSGNALIEIGEASSGGSPSGQITIENWLRDNTASPSGGDIKATAATFGLNILNASPHTGGMTILANGASGRIIGTAVTTIDQGQNLTTDSWQTYTPTVTPTTLGNGTLTGRFKRLGKEYRAEIRMTLGSTTAIGNLRFSLPVTPIDGVPVSATVTDVSTGAVFQLGGYISTDGLARVHPVGTNGAMVTITPTVPHTWETGDTVVVDVRYRVS